MPFLMGVGSVINALTEIADRIGPKLMAIILNLPGLIFIIFAIVAVSTAIRYTGNAFWDSIPSADPRYNHSVDDFVDAKPFSALPTFSK